MKRLMLLAAISAVIPLAGCVTAEQIAERDDATCQSYGAQQGTPGYADCRLRIAGQRQQAQQAFYAQLAQNARDNAAANNAILSQYQATLARQQPVAMTPLPMPTTTRCVRTSDITVNCTTN